MKHFELCDTLCQVKEGNVESIKVTPHLLELCCKQHYAKVQALFRGQKECISLQTADPYDPEEVKYNPSNMYHEKRPVSQGAQFSLPCSRTFVSAMMLKADKLEPACPQEFHNLRSLLTVFYGLEELLTDAETH